MPSSSGRSRRSASRSSSVRSRRPTYRDAAQQAAERPSRPRSSSPRNPRRTRSPRARSSASYRNRKRFGMNVYDHQYKIGKFDFEDKYPEDPIYEELGPNARAWRVNLDECEVYDNDMVIEARDGLDLLLVFAGLFSAVLTTFVAQTSQALSNNFPAVSTSLLFEMVTLQRAIINGTPVDGISPSAMTSGPSGFDIWVNALWFTSLALSLGTALVAVLVKQWLYQYMSIITGTARDRSLIRFYRFDGLRKWHVLTIISTLPIVLHLALALFLAGLVIFLVPRSVPLASVVGFITIIIYMMYIVSNILPIIYTQCPYQTPFSDILNILMRPMLSILSTSTVTYPSNSIFPTLKEAERNAATGDDVAELVACDALLWLYQMTSNPPTKSIILQSLGSLSEDVSDRLTVINIDMEKALEEVIHEPRYRWSILPGQESRAERLLRAQRHIEQPKADRSWWEAGPEAFNPPFNLLISILTYAPTGSVESRKGEARKWSSYDLNMHIMHEYSAGHPILLPPALWQRFMPVLRRIFNTASTDKKLSLCRLTLQALDKVNSERTIPPFAGGIPAPLENVITDLLPHNDLPDSQPLRQLCIINDYIVSEIANNRNTVTDGIPVLLDIWRRIATRDHNSSGDSQAICRHAEKCILEVFVGDWWDTPSDTDSDDLKRCYRVVVERYWWHGIASGLHSVVPSPELFAKLFSELCWWTSAKVYMSHNSVCYILEHAFGLDVDVDVTSSYYTLFCGSESPLFSPRTKCPLSDFLVYIFHVMATFVHGLARDSHSEVLTPRCMDIICADPDRLFTICRVLALGSSLSYYEKEEVTANVLKLARLDPNRAAWMDRTHYLTGIEPWDWPYLSIPKDHGQIVHVQERMKLVLKVLDNFFASLDNPLNSPATSPPSELLTVSAAGQLSVVDHEPQPRLPMGFPSWRRLRQLVLSMTAFQRSSSPVCSIPPSQSNYLSFRMPAGESHYEPHTLAIEAPSSLSTARPSSSHDISRPADDSMV